MNSATLPPAGLSRVLAAVRPQRFAEKAREALLIATCAVIPAFALYCWDGARPARPVAMAQPVPKDALWIDARPATEYTREHIPEALNLNPQNWDENLAQVFATWQPPRPIMVYCAAGCSSATEVAEKLTALGIEPVNVYQGGFEAWKQATASSGN